MEQLLTVKEACEYLKVARPTLYKYMDKGVRGVTLAYVNVGGTRRIRQSAIDQFISESTVAGALADSDTIESEIEMPELTEAELLAA